MTTDGDWRRLAAAVRHQREVELGLTQEQVAARGGPSTATQRLIEGALQDAYRLRTLASLEDVLGWRKGSVRTVLQGGDPVPVEAPADTHLADRRLNDPPAGISNDEVIEYLDEITRRADELKRRMVRGRRGGPGPLAGAP